MMYAHTESATKAVLKVKEQLSEKFKIMNRGPARQFLSIEIHCDENVTGINFGQKAFTTTSLKQFHLQHAHGIKPRKDTNVKLD
jgi:hypothetical protein